MEIFCKPWLEIQYYIRGVFDSFMCSLLGLVWEPHNRPVYRSKPMSPSTRVGKYLYELCGVWKPTGGKSITRVGTGFHGWRKHAFEGRARNTRRGSSSTPRLISSFRFSRRSPQPPPSPSPPASPTASEEEDMDSRVGR
jgi:hypothetical protein